MHDPAAHPIFALSSALVERVAHLWPSHATLWGLDEHDHAWEDLSPEGVAAWTAFLQDAERELRALAAGAGPMDRWARLAVDVAEAWVAQELAAAATQEGFRRLAHLETPLQLLHLTLTYMKRDTEAQRDALRARLAGMPEVLGGYRTSLAYGLDIGERASVRQVRSGIAQGRNLVEQRLLDLVPGPEADVAHQAYADFTDWLEQEYLPRADPADGVGETRYRPAAERFLHDRIDLDETYTWGWSLVEDLHRDLTGVRERVAPGRTLAEAVQAWRTDPATTAPDPERFLARVQAWQEQAMALLDGVVPIPPLARELRVERAPLGLPPGAWYCAPSEDGQRPGIVQYSLRDGPVPAFDQQSTACHEGFPGHHLQLAIQTSLQDRLSRLHRLVYQCTGFAEGWALYAERLVDEHHGYDDDHQRAGFLVNQIARACRVVLDIGLHTGRAIPSGLALPYGDDTGLAPGAQWTFDRAVAFMTEIGGLRPEVSHSEITRYLGWPGQAISYSVGMKRMLEVRERFLARGGTLPAFHDRVLGSGMVGLGRMAQTVLDPA